MPSDYRGLGTGIVSLRIAVVSATMVPSLECMSPEEGTDCERVYIWSGPHHGGINDFSVYFWGVFRRNAASARPIFPQAI